MFRRRRATRVPKEGRHRGLIRNLSMKVFHGTVYNKPIVRPLVDVNKDTNDAGDGFYTCPDESYAKIIGMDRANQPEYDYFYVNTYVFDDEGAESVKPKRFKGDEEWAQFVLECRTDRYDGEFYPIIYMPSADAQLKEAIDLYERMLESGDVDYSVLLRMMNPDRLSEQIVFKSQDCADEYLKLERFCEYDKHEGPGIEKLPDAVPEGVRKGPQRI